MSQLRVGMVITIEDSWQFLVPHADSRTTVRTPTGLMFEVCQDAERDSIRILRRVGNPQVTPAEIATDPRFDA